MIALVVLSIAFGAVYYLSVLIGTTYSAGSTWQAGFGKALFFGTFWFLVTYPVILAVQAGLAYLVRRVRRIQESRASVWEFLPCMLLSALVLSASIPESPESQFRRFVADRVPPSVSTIMCWHGASFSGKNWVLSFTVAPEDLDAVINRYPYVKEDLASGYLLEIPGGVIEAPKEPMAYGSPIAHPHPRDPAGWRFT